MQVNIPSNFIFYGTQTESGPNGSEVATFCFAAPGCTNPWTDPTAYKISMQLVTYNSLMAYISDDNG